MFFSSPPFREGQKGYWPSKYGEDQDKEKERAKDINFQQLKTHNEELYQPILYGNYFNNPTLMYHYQTEKSQAAAKTTAATAINEDETTDNFAPDFMQPSKAEFDNMYKCKRIPYKQTLENINFNFFFYSMQIRMRFVACYRTPERCTASIWRQQLNSIEMKMIFLLIKI